MGEGTGQDPGGGSLKDRGAPASTSGGAAVGRWLLLTGRRLQWGGAERQGPRPELRSACVCPGGTRCPRGVGVGAASGHRGAPLGGPDPPGQQVADAQDPATAGGRGGSLALSAARGPVAPHRALGLGLARGKVPGSHPEDEGPVHRGHVRTTVSTPDPMAHWQTLLGPLPGGGLVPQPETPTSPPAPSSAALCPEARTPASPRVPAAPVYPSQRVPDTSHLPQGTDTGPRTDTALSLAARPSQPPAQPAPCPRNSERVPGKCRPDSLPGHLPPGASLWLSHPSPSRCLLGAPPGLSCPMSPTSAWSPAEPRSMQPQRPSWKGWPGPVRQGPQQHPPHPHTWSLPPDYGHRGTSAGSQPKRDCRWKTPVAGGPREGWVGWRQRPLDGGASGLGTGGGHCHVAARKTPERISG